MSILLKQAFFFKKKRQKASDFGDKVSDFVDKASDATDNLNESADFFRNRFDQIEQDTRRQIREGVQKGTQLAHGAILGAGTLGSLGAVNNEKTSLSTKRMAKGYLGGAALGALAGAARTNKNPTLTNSLEAANIGGVLGAASGSIYHGAKNRREKKKLKAIQNSFQPRLLPEPSYHPAESTHLNYNQVLGH